MLLSQGAPRLVPKVRQVNARVKKKKMKTTQKTYVSYSVTVDTGYKCQRDSERQGDIVF